ncbi:hypothetical protein [Fibrobacter sp. UWB4]|uniref:hypothetical protein n=1 Tax=Fibrobacter sp. UWB4 TaxID=1964356 RepID=UPI0011318669|nr:hypothetical protein [Fibrobacter sp. UWB4]
MQKAFPEELADLSSDLVKIVFSSNIYSLYGKLKDDDGFLDVVEVIKEQHKEDKELQDLDRESVSQVFLFFDLDIHGLAQSIEQSCEQLCELVKFFNNETENGKLFLSYPMVEVVNICDQSNGLLPEDRKLFKICDCEEDGFKHFVNDLNRDSKTICRANCRENWLIISKANYEKAKWLMKLPTGTLSLEQMQQPTILQHQQVLIKNEGVVATLSAFPFFLLEYLGAGKMQNLLL